MSTNSISNETTAALAALASILTESDAMGESNQALFAPIHELHCKLSNLIAANAEREDLLSCLKEVDHALQEFSNRLISEMLGLLP